jgi:arylsulfatase A-like enzyme
VRPAPHVSGCCVWPPPKSAQGWNYPGYHNPEVITPTLDKLAAGGVRLESHYTYKYCSPTRAALLVGRMPYHLPNVRCNLIPSSSPEGTPLGYSMLPLVLAPAGYVSHAIGKWCAPSSPPASAVCRRRRCFCRSSLLRVAGRQAPRPPDAGVYTRGPGIQQFVRFPAGGRGPLDALVRGVQGDLRYLVAGVARPGAWCLLSRVVACRGP